MTLFLVVGRREKFMEGGKSSFSERIDFNEEFKAYLKELSEDDRFEIAFHGYTHGKILDKYLTQEWLTFASLEEACQTIELSKDIYRKVTGKEFYGGKYCGYEYNEFSDESIARAGFEWWCRHYDASLYTGRGTGVENLDMEEFQGVVDIPSTVDGGLCSLLNIKAVASRDYLKAIYYLLKYRITIEKVLDRLVRNGQVLNIQEHSSPMREDDKHQRPNLVDDISSVRMILRYLQRYDLWYATGHEIAEYWKTYQYAELVPDGNGVIIRVSKPAITGLQLWLAVADEGRVPTLKCGEEEIKGKRDGKRYLFEVSVQDGKRYEVIYR